MSRFAGASCVLLGSLLALVAAAQDDAGSNAGTDAADTVPLGVVRPVDPTGEPSTVARIILGRKLFTDPRISADGTLSCASCHVAALAFTDGRSVPVGMGGKRLARNSPTLLNVGLVRDLFHDGRAPSLEEQARAVFLNADELGWSDAAQPAHAIAAVADYPPLFADAFGDETVTLQRMLRAIAAFERTLLAGNSPFDRWWHGADEHALSAAAERGYRAFIGAGGCVQCHSIRQSYATFEDGRFHNTGAGADAGEGVGKDDPGRMTVTGDADDRGAFRTPTLRNVELTAPYMHDGSLATLEDVIDFYVQGGGANANLSPLVRPLELDEQDRADLVAFLRALTSPDLPRLEECDRLLAAGRPREALALFRNEMERNPANDAAARGLGRAALVLDEHEPLLEAERALRRRTRERAAAGDLDGAPAIGEDLIVLGDVNAALSRHEDAMAMARAEDALRAYDRVRTADGVAPDLRERATERLVPWLLQLGRPDRAVQVAEEESARPAHRGASSNKAQERLAATLYQRAWRRLADGPPDDATRRDLLRAAESFDELVARGAALSDESLLFRAYCRHYRGEIEAARAAYLDAIRSSESVAEKALAGLRSLLARDLARYIADVDGLARDLPDSPAVLYFVGWERLRQGRLDDAERALRRRIAIENEPSAGPNVYLARIAAARDDREAATALYGVALALDARFPGLVAEFEGYIRSRELDGFPAVDALISDYSDTFLPANPDDRRFQCLARNNLAFLLREVASSFTSRGPARIQTFPAGAPGDARRIARACLATYAEAVALIPDDVSDLPFGERWVYAGVLNDTGLIVHYFAALQDLERAESLYLRAFDLTGGAYMDTYFYNLQFLYGFELPGHEEQWFELSRIAKDAILKEDATSPTGFAPDGIKRRAALRDFERLSSALGR